MISKKLRLQIGGLVILSGLTYVVLQGSHNFSQYFVPVSQFKAEMQRFSGKTIRVQGKLLASSASYNPKTQTLDFTLSSKNATLPVTYTGPMPNEQFKNANAIVEGRLGPNGVFQAKQLEIQCPDHVQAVPST